MAQPKAKARDVRKRFDTAEARLGRLMAAGNNWGYKR